MQHFLALTAIMFTLVATAPMGAKAKADALNLPITEPIMVRIPHGLSELQIKLNQMSSANPLQIIFAPTVICPSVTVGSLQVKYADDAQWYPATVENSTFFRHRGGNIESLKVLFNEVRFRGTTCQIQITGMVDSGVPPTPPTEPDESSLEYVGFLGYQGGYFHRGVVTWESPASIDQFEIRIPSYCQGVEIVEAGALDPAQKFISAFGINASRHLYRFSTPQTLNQIQVSLNGPKAQACDIPVYIVKQQVPLRSDDELDADNG
ncbi:MAG: hypothetical protein RL011_1842 [Pseudomonadota bacterium]|jgi:hypothetical protein